MTLDEFRQSLTATEPPAGLTHALAGLWWDAKGDWTRAHESAQQDEGVEGAWVHAYLHRKEGDQSNAAYWYRRAGNPCAGSRSTGNGSASPKVCFSDQRDNAVAMELSFEQALIEVWRQALVDDLNAVEVGPERYPVKHTPKRAERFASVLALTSEESPSLIHLATVHAICDVKGSCRLTLSLRIPFLFRSGLGLSHDRALQLLR